MIQEASVTGLLRMIFIIIGVITVLRFIGKLMIARRERDKLNNIEQQQEAIRKAKVEAQKNHGKISIHASKSNVYQDPTVDVDFEESDL